MIHYAEHARCLPCIISLNSSQRPTIDPNISRILSSKSRASPRREARYDATGDRRLATGDIVLPRKAELPEVYRFLQLSHGPLPSYVIVCLARINDTFIGLVTS